jgi:hypothetical protein
MGDRPGAAWTADGAGNRTLDGTVSAAMTTTTARRSLLALLAVAAFGLSACASAAAPSAPPAADPTPGSVPTPSGPPAASTDPGAGAGGGSAGDPGSGIGVGPVDPAPIDPSAGEPKLVQPVPGRQNPHPVMPTALQASVDGRHVLVQVSWYGGVEPCSVLDSVRVERSATEIAITPIEGSSDPTAICMEMALLKATIVDLGELAPGTWRISSPGSEAPPAVITID